MKHINIYILLACTMVILVMSCEDPIDVTLEDGGVQLVVDAWISNLPEDQVITLTSSQQYFDSSQPPAVTDASVSILSSSGEVFSFEHRGEGRYVWTSNNQTFGSVGDVMELKVDYENSVYSSSATILRVPVIDSIGFEFREDEIFLDDGLYAQFYSRDPMGLGDTYWIKTFYNGEYLDKSQELNIAYDAGFDAGTGIDGLIFIPPVREFVNRLDEDLLSIPYEVGDTVRVEIHSISNQAFNFLEIARDQINNGDNGIFSIPLANARTNITADDGSQVLGFFNVSAVESKERIAGE